MSGRVYPRTAWVLLPSFKPKAVEIDRPYQVYPGNDYGDVTSTGKSYWVSEMFESKAAAIAAGRANLEVRRAKLQDMASKIDAQAIALDKAEAAT